MKNKYFLLAFKDVFFISKQMFTTCSVTILHFMAGQSFLLHIGFRLSMLKEIGRQTQIKQFLFSSILSCTE